jgi:hypothetical protein
LPDFGSLEADLGVWAELTGEQHCLDEVEFKRANGFSLVRDVVDWGGHWGRGLPVMA